MISVSALKRIDKCKLGRDTTELTTFILRHGDIVVVVRLHVFQIINILFKVILDTDGADECKLLILLDAILGVDAYTGELSVLIYRSLSKSPYAPS